MLRQVLMASAMLPLLASIATGAPPLETPVPEPATLGLLLAVGAGALLIARARRK